MTLWFTPLTWTILLLVPHTPVTAKEGEEQPPAGTCVQVSARVRYNMGYDHLVDLTNGCKKPTVCQVATNVNPKTQEVRLSVGANATVMTFVGSPAREFTPQVDCAYQ